jgi:hypothetical protein
LSVHAPDPNWKFTDGQGHLHRFEGDKLPTLKAVIQGALWCDECGESHAHTTYICKECRQPVEPIYLPADVVPILKQEEARLQKGKDFNAFFQTVPVGPMGGAVGATGPVGNPGPVGSTGPVGRGPLTISSLEIRADRAVEGGAAFTKAGALEFTPARMIYTMIVNRHIEIPLTEIEVQVATEAAKSGEVGMRSFAVQVLRDRGYV